MQEPTIIILDLEIIPDLPKALKYWCKLSSFPGKTLSASVTSICCAGWKLLDSDETHCINAWDYPEWEHNVNDDRRLCADLLKVLECADSIVTHNGKRFDKKYLQTRLAIHHMQLLRNDPHSDTKSISSSNFKFIDNRLQTIGEELFDERKMEHEGWDLWVKTHGRDRQAMETMEAYCKQDVLLLEKVYKHFRPVDKTAPNRNVFLTAGHKPVCSKCGSTRLRSNGYRATKTMTYKRYQCMGCGSWHRTDASDKRVRGI